MKKRYRCRLLGFKSAGNKRLIARIVRLEEHDKLGPPPHPSSGLYTQTSVIARIDFEKHEIETQNSIYVYGRQV